jgi:hypothetical protein
MTDREVMQQALEAWGDPMGMKDLCVAMDAMRTALEQPEQEQDSTCNKTLRAEGKGYTRTCKKCGKGPCIADRVQPEQEHEYKGCACRWNEEGDRTVTCERHQGWLEVIAEWADRAREAEAKLKAAAQRQPPEWWPAVENILNEYGLQAIDFVADFKAAQINSTTSAAPVQDGRDWSLLEATQESLREHSAEIRRLKAIIEAAEKQEPVASTPSSTRFTVHVEGCGNTYWDNIHDAITSAQRAVYAGVDATTRAIDDLKAGRIAEWSYGFSAVRIYPPDRASHTTPPAAQRPWVGLTDDEIVEIAKQTKSAEPGRNGYILPVSFAQSIEAKLKERNT